MLLTIATTYGMRTAQQPGRRLLAPCLATFPSRRYPKTDSPV